MIDGDSDTARDAVITGYYERADRCIRDQKWSLIVRPAGEQDELYDLENDRRETTNVIENHPEVAERLRGAFGAIYFGRTGPGVEGQYEFKGVQGAYEMASRVVE